MSPKRAFKLDFRSGTKDFIYLRTATNFPCYVKESTMIPVLYKKASRRNHCYYFFFFKKAVTQDVFSDLPPFFSFHPHFFFLAHTLLLVLARSPLFFSLSPFLFSRLRFVLFKTISFFSLVFFENNFSFFFFRRFFLQYITHATSLQVIAIVMEARLVINATFSISLMESIFLLFQIWPASFQVQKFHHFWLLVSLRTAQIRKLNWN